MKRAAAERLVGRRVAAWTGQWGEYAGTLVEVAGARPWRGVVRVEEVLRWPTPTDVRRRAEDERRRPFREGFLLNVGGVNIEPFDGPARSWRESAVAAAEELRASLGRPRSLSESFERGGEWHVEQWSRVLVVDLALLRAGLPLDGWVVEHELTGERHAGATYATRDEAFAALRAELKMAREWRVRRLVPALPTDATTPAAAEPDRGA